MKFSISHGGGFFASKSILSENRPPLKLFKEHKSLVPGRNSKICFLFPGSTIEILLTVSHSVAELPGEHRQLGHVDVLLGPAGLRQVELPASLALSPGVAETLIMMSVNHKVLILVSWEPGRKY